MERVLHENGLCTRGGGWKENKLHVFWDCCKGMEVWKGILNSLYNFFNGLSKRTTTEGLQEAFSKFGEVVQARVVTDRTSGYSKGFGFVRYATLENAAEGIKGMDGQYLLKKQSCSICTFVPWCSPGNQGFWMDGLYLQSMQDPNHHLLNPRTTWVQDMETTLVLITAGSDPDVRENKFSYSISMVTSIYSSAEGQEFFSALQSMGAQPEDRAGYCAIHLFFRVSAITRGVCIFFFKSLYSKL
ncbi:hypothetical protein DKX38_025935 [Salix brachista]|uniref:RRM domain-containing protein n=1 Tax=Salix brachista TaxID=2182728 RepID=A0A5N5JS73_9ROSI|nr:hypothetical protein DKX38_025935 [Salix brachista]